MKNICNIITKDYNIYYLKSFHSSLEKIPITERRTRNRNTNFILNETRRYQ